MTMQDALSDLSEAVDNFNDELDWHDLPEEQETAIQEEVTSIEESITNIRYILRG